MGASIFMNDLFMILIFNLILFFVVFYISQNYKELFSKVDSLTFRINYINIVFLSFVPIFENGLLKYRKEEYVFLFFYFIIYITLSIKFSFLKRATALCIVIPYSFFYEIPELMIGDIGILLLFPLNFIQSFIQYKKNTKDKSAIFSMVVIILILAFLFLRQLYWDYYYDNLIL